MDIDADFRAVLMEQAHRQVTVKKALMPSPVSMAAFHSMYSRIPPSPIKVKPYHPDTAACLPALMQTLCFDVPGLDIVNLAEMIPCVLRYAENVDQRLVVAVLIPRLSQFLKIKLLMFLVCKNHVCCWRSAPLLLTLCCSCVNLL